MATTPKVIEIVGSLNIDLVTVTPRVPGPGETLTASSFTSGFGGKGANQCVACARLLRAAPQAAPEDGVVVRMIGATGDDQFGIDFRNHLEREGIDTSALTVKNSQSTGTAVILVEEQTGENRILFTPGANGDVKSTDIQLDSDAGLVILQLEIPIPVVLDTLSKAKSQGKHTIFNPAPAIQLSRDVWKYVDHLILNESEASIFSGIPEVELSDDYDKLAKYFHDLGVAVVVLTLGSKGVFWSHYNVAAEEKTSDFVRARKVQVADTTAAGDCFVGAYAVWLTRHSESSVAGAVKFANHAAALSVQKHGAQASIPFLAEIEHLNLD